MWRRLARARCRNRVCLTLARRCTRHYKKWLSQTDYRRSARAKCNATQCGSGLEIIYSATGLRSNAKPYRDSTARLYLASEWIDSWPRVQVLTLTFALWKIFRRKQAFVIATLSTPVRTSLRFNCTDFVWTKLQLLSHFLSKKTIHQTTYKQKTNWTQTFDS